MLLLLVLLLLLSLKAISGDGKLVVVVGFDTDYPIVDDDSNQQQQQQQYFTSLFLSDDFGVSWRTAPINNDNNNNNNNNNDNNNIPSNVAVSRSGRFIAVSFKNNNILLSDDLGLSFSPITTTTTATSTTDSFHNNSNTNNMGYGKLSFGNDCEFLLVITNNNNDNNNNNNFSLLLGVWSQFNGSSTPYYNNNNNNSLIPFVWRDELHLGTTTITITTIIFIIDNDKIGIATHFTVAVVDIDLCCCCYYCCYCCCCCRLLLMGKSLWELDSLLVVVIVI